MGKITDADIEAFIRSLTDKQGRMILRAMFFGFTFGVHFGMFWYWLCFTG